MIDPKELRIGNYLKWQNNAQIFDIMLTHFLDKYFWVHIERGHILPVILTPEILQKCGLLNEVLPGIFPDIEYFSVNDGSLYFNGEYTATDLKYLHQLQNIYFALSGSELEISFDIERKWPPKSTF